MKRVVVLGRGGSGKSTLCRRLGEVTGLPILELDSIYWDDALRVLEPGEWWQRQADVVSADEWILDGDLGPHDVLEPRLGRADTIIILDTPLSVCAWRAVRRGRQRLDFWAWVMTWGWKHRPRILADIWRHAPTAEVVRLRSARSVESYLVNSGSGR